MVVGPAFSFASLAAGPIYATAGTPSLPIATSDAITQNATTFHLGIKNSAQGVMLATYLQRVLHLRHAVVVVADDGYGRTLQMGFARAADTLGIDAQYLHISREDQAEQIAKTIAADPARPAVVFLTLDGDASRVLTILKRLGPTGPILGADGLGDNFGERFAGLPEEREQPGYFTEGALLIAPMILNSANAEIQAFAGRFRARFGHDPVSFATACYDVASVAAATARRIGSSGSDVGSNTASQRAAAMQYLLSLNSPERALPGILGPIWFDANRGRPQAIRIGRFAAGKFEFRAFTDGSRHPAKPDGHRLRRCLRNPAR